MSITIVIPTYNRLPALKRTLSVITPQLNDEVKLLIVDNFSDESVKQSLGVMGIPNNIDRIQVVRNVANIGLSGNIIKCFELCDTDWMWLLGDDDIPLENAVQTIQHTIATCDDTVYINFNSNLCQFGGKHDDDVINYGQADLIKNLKSFPNLLFISSGIYKVSAMKSSIKNGYYFCNTFAPHIAILLDTLRNNLTCKTLFSCDYISEWRAPLDGKKWGDDIVNKSVQDLVYLVKDENIRSIFFAKIIEFHPYNSISAIDTIASFLKSDSTEKHDLIADYFSSQSFIYWASQSDNNSIALRFLKTSALLLLCNIGLVNYAIMYLVRKKNKKERSIYNKFLTFVKDTRL